MLNKIGKWKIFALETGDFRLDGGAMMGSVPKVLWEKTNPCDELNRIDLSMRCLLLDNGKDVVLIEAGIGNKNNEKFMNMFSVCESTFPLQDKLREYGYKLTDITHVILTHLHFDHAGGATCYVPTASWWYNPNPGVTGCQACYLGVNQGYCTDGIDTCPAGTLGTDYYSDLSTCDSETGASSPPPGP